jgi:hypothetical protein
MDARRFQGNCGIVEISGLWRWTLPEPYDLTKTFIKTYLSYRQGADRTTGTLFPMVVFTDALSSNPEVPGNGEQIAEKLSEMDIGAVKKQAAVTNPNTGRRIALWTWTPSKEYRNKMKGKTITNTQLRGVG